MESQFANNFQNSKLNYLLECHGCVFSTGLPTLMMQQANKLCITITYEERARTRAVGTIHISRGAYLSHLNWDRNPGRIELKTVATAS